MRRREAKRAREREELPTALAALIQLVPADADTRRFLQEQFVTAPAHNGEGDDNDEGDAVIDGEGLQRLVEALGEEACPEGVMDVLRIARRVPRCQSTPSAISVAELCFALSQATAPANVRERRQAAVAGAGPVDVTSPLLQYYKNNGRFQAIVRGEDPSSPTRRHTVSGGSGEGSSNEGPGAHHGTPPPPPSSSSTTAPPRKGEENDSDDDTEWKRFVESVGTPLPMSLRVHHSEPSLRQAALTILQNDEEVRQAVHRVPCVPPSLELYSCPHTVYHSQKRVEYICRTLHASSAVSFQEVVSALPVLVLGLEPHHTVLEMCAAPGSKTLQALDCMLRNGWSQGTQQGVMITNEKDRVKATQTLPARLKRYHAPNVMCTRCDGIQWPRLYVAEDTVGRDTVLTDERRFDRVICDVPCSGDGTIRKERSVTTTWSASYVKSLVPTQKALLRRGLDLLADDGVLVYSTCSMNPKEDEEVVCAGLELFGDSVELLDVNATLAAKGASLHSSGGIASPNVEGLQPPVLPTTYDGSRVLRVLPHRDNTGGFFVAAFHKRKQPDWTAPTVTRAKLNQWMKGKLWSPVACEDPTWVNIASFYGMNRHDRASFSYYDGCKRVERGEVGSSDVPSSSPSSSAAATGLVPVYHLNPNGGPSRRIVLVTRALADMLLKTYPYKGPGVEVVSVGVRAFEQYDGRFLVDAACRWRAVVEAASYLAPRFTSRKLRFYADVHRALLQQLFQDGFVPLRTYWMTILGDPTVVESKDNDGTLEKERTAPQPYPFVKPGPLTELITRVRRGEAVAEDVADSATELFYQQVEMGGVLVGVRHTATSSATAEATWYLSATLSGSKLELAVDASLRAFGLMTYLGICNTEAPVSEEAKAAEKLEA